MDPFTKQEDFLKQVEETLKKKRSKDTYSQKNREIISSEITSVFSEVMNDEQMNNLIIRLNQAKPNPGDQANLILSIYHQPYYGSSSMLKGLSFPYLRSQETVDILLKEEYNTSILGNLMVSLGEDFIESYFKIKLDYINSKLEGDVKLTYVVAQAEAVPFESFVDPIELTNKDKVTSYLPTKGLAVKQLEPKDILYIFCYNVFFSFDTI